jgi:hypothetical protein
MKVYQSLFESSSDEDENGQDDEGDGVSDDDGDSNTSE